MRTASDSVSIARYGERGLSQHNLLHRNRFGQDSWAYWLLRRFSEPRRWADLTVELHRDGQDVDKALALELDDAVTLDLVGESRTMYVEGVSHRFTPETWTVGVVVTPVDMWRAWVLGTVGMSELGSTTWLG